MTVAEMRRKKRIIACVVSFAVLAAVILSAFFIVIHADHDCTGEDCHICACMRICGERLRGTGAGETLRPAASLPVLLFALTAMIPACGLLPEMPVASKVRLNN